MKIHKIETGKVRVKLNQISKADWPAPKMAKLFLDSDWSEWLPIYAWLIEHDEGIFLVDTGETYKTGVKGYLPKWHPYYGLAADFKVNKDEEIGPKLNDMGINPAADVSKVIMTHLHTDHAGGMYHFPNAEFIIEKSEFKTASGITGILAGYLPHRWPEWLDPELITLPENRFGPFERSLPLTNDKKIRLVATPGHVPGHISVIAEEDDIYYFLAGDTSYNQTNMMNLVPDGVGTKGNIETLKKIRLFSKENPVVYLPSHDPGAEIRLKEKETVPLYGETVMI